MREIEEYSGYLERFATSFDLETRLPSRVHRQRYRNFVACDFDWAMSAAFWASLRQMVEQSGGKGLFGVLDPDPIAYFHKEFGDCPFFELDSHRTEADYWDALARAPVDSPADAPLYNSEVVVWVPFSTDWAIWGQRSCGICVLGTLGEPIVEVGQNWHPLHMVDDALLRRKVEYGDITLECAEALSASYNG